jgi:hypothetical protein
VFSLESVPRNYKRAQKEAAGSRSTAEYENENGASPSDLYD